MACEFRAGVRNRAGGNELLVRHAGNVQGPGLLRRTVVPALIALIILAAPRPARSEQASIQFDAPLPQGRCVALGTVEFPVGALRSSDSIRVLSGALEVPAAMVASDSWPDGSIMSVDLAFPVEDATQPYSVQWGAQRRNAVYEFTPRSNLKTVSFSTGPSAGPSLDVQVGQLTVRVDKHPGLYYYWYLVPIAAILAALIYRKARLR